jgi:hypothetical protein|tara:strand:+ start:3569 stop:3958 length:390 start_codon:yes stop_codon:yes gene_type:complete
MSCPTDVVDALNNPAFCANHKEFWQMTHFLFSEYNGIQVWTAIPPDTFRAMAIQLHTVIETVDCFTDLQSRAEVIFRTYIVCLTKIRGVDSLQQTMFRESSEVLQALHNIYRLLFRLKVPALPLFGHVK